MTLSKRAVGYCMLEDYPEYLRGVYLLGAGDRFHCPRCAIQGLLEAEREEYGPGSAAFKQVRVEFDFDPLHRRYKGLAIVRDESIPQGRAFTLYTSLVRSDKRALKIAEAILGNLNTHPEEPSSARREELLLNMDEEPEEYRKQLTELGQRWERMLSLP